MAAELRALLLLFIVLPCVFADSDGWKEAHVTYYGTPDGTIGGACGYEEYKQIYSPYTAALSSALFNDAASCGACYEIKCMDSKDSKGYCKKDSVVVTATDLCPPGDSWCSSGKEHFDLSQPAFLKIAEQVAGHVPVQYRKVPCKRSGGEKFKISGNPNFNLITVTNVGGGGDVKKVEVKAEDEEKWTELKRNWGENWDTNHKLTGQALAFRVTTNDGKVVTSKHVAPKTWQFGHIFEGENI